MTLQQIADKIEYLLHDNYPDDFSRGSSRVARELDALKLDIEIADRRDKEDAQFWELHVGPTESRRK